MRNAYGNRIRQMLNRILFTVSLLLACATASAQNVPSSTLWLAQDDALTPVSTHDGIQGTPVELPGLLAFDVDARTGQLWVATTSGLYLLDVHGVILVGPVAIPEAVSDVVSVIADAGTAGAWLVGAQTIAYVDSGVNVTSPAFAPAAIVDVEALSDGSALVLLESGLHTLSAGGEWTLRNALDGVRNARLIEVDDTGAAWIAGKQTIARLTPEFGAIALRFDTPLKAPRQFDVGPNGSLWLADNHRLIALDVDGQLYYDDAPGSSGSGGNGARITGLAFDVQLGKPWLSDNHQFFDLLGNDGDIAGGAIKSLRVFSDLTPPEIVITAPEAESYTNNPQPDLALAYGDVGVGVAPDSLALSLNDVPLAADCERASEHATCLPLEVIPDGYHRLNATIEDMVGNLSDSAEVRFTVDTVPPEITLLNPEDGTYTNQPLTLVEGALSEWANLTVNAEGVAVSSALTFEAEWLLREGENALHIVAEDRATNQGVLDAAVMLDTRPPTLAVTTPTEGKTVASRTIVVRGNIDEMATVAVNGQPVNVEDNGSFMTDVGLVEGGNSIAIQATDRAGNIANAFRNVELDTTPPSPPDAGLISFSEPDQNGRVTVTGLPGAAEPGSTVVITLVISQSGVLGESDERRTYRTVANDDGSFDLRLEWTEDGFVVVEVQLEDRLGRTGPSVTWQPGELPNHTDTLVGALSGEFSVDPTGAANYRLPLPVPHGAAGMQPDLALLYSSRAGEGQLGPGWSLSGLSVVSRCPRNQAIDGLTRGVRFDAEDRYCLDGQRLLLDDPSQQYGASGTRYHTEIASFQRVTAMGGSPASGPDYFKVEDKSGLIRWYGKAPSGPDGRIALQGTDIAREWLVTRIEDRIEDRIGNRIDFSYARNSEGAQEYWVENISWFNVLGQRLGKVRFSYRELNEPRLFYTVAGTAGQASKLLTSFSISAREFKGSTLQSVGTYKLHYSGSKRTQRDLLTAVEYCPHDSACLPKTLFEYRNEPLKYGDARRYFGDFKKTARFVDIDKDGRVDRVWVQGDRIRFSRKFNVTVDTGIYLDNDLNDRYTFMDANSDGYLDLVVPNKSGNARFNIYPWDPDAGTYSKTRYASFFAYASAEGMPMAVDVDADGRQEIIARAKFKHNEHPVLVVYKFDADNKLTYYYNGFGIDLKQPLHVMDINADGMPDLLLEPRNCTLPRLSSGGPYIPEPDEPISTAPRLSCSESAGFLVNDGGNFVHAVRGNPLAGYDGAPPVIDPDLDYPNPGEPPPGGEIPLVGLLGNGAASEIETQSLLDPEGIDYEPPQQCELLPSNDDDTEHHCEPRPDPGDRPPVRDFSWKPTWVKPADVNGDGLTDIVWYLKELNTWALVLNEGTQWREVWSGERSVLSKAEFDQSMVTDVNGDGIADLVIVDGDKARLLHGRGDRFEGNYLLPYRSAGFMMQDFGGDGAPEIAYIDGAWKAHFNNAAHADHLTGIVNGYGEQIRVVYAGLSGATIFNRPLYRGHLSAADIDLQGGQQQPFMAPMHVVAAFSVDTGTANPIFTSYSYYGAQVDVGGRGFLGFREVSAFNQNSRIETVNRHRQAFPFTGMVESSRQYVPDAPVTTVPAEDRDRIFDDPCMLQPTMCEGDYSPQASARETEQAPKGTLISHTVNIMKEVAHDVTRFGRLPIVERTTTRTFDYHSGEFLKSEETYSEYGEHGNVTFSKVSTTGADINSAHTISTTNGYADDADKWCLGRLDQSTVVHQWRGRTETRKSSFEYDMESHCQLTAEILEPESEYELRTDYHHDPFGNVDIKSVSGNDGQGPVTRSTYTTYDPSGRYVEKVENGAEHIETYAWDARYGVKTQHTGPNGLPTEYEYDAIGRVTVTRAPTGAESTVHRAWCEQVACEQPDATYRILNVSADGTVSQDFYDHLQRKVGSRVADIGDRRYEAFTVYDLRGRQIAISNSTLVGSNKRCWSFVQYDNLDREVARYTPSDAMYCGADTVPSLQEVQSYYAQPPAGYRVSRTVYDGLTTYTQSPNGRVQSRTVHANGWLAVVSEHGKTSAISPGNTPAVLMQDGIALQVRYHYDAQGNTREVVDPKGNRVVMEYDKLGRKRSMDDPDMGQWEYRYNNFGELVWQQDARKQIVEMRYDALGRMIERSEAEGVTTWQYDTAPGAGKGKLASVVQHDGYVAAYRYDEYGRLERQVQRLDGYLFEQAFEYDDLGRVIAQHYPALEAANARDTADVLARAANDTAHTAGYHVSYQYDKSRLKSVTAPDGQTLWKLANLDDGGNINHTVLGNGKQEYRRIDLASGELRNIRLGYILGDYSENYQWDGAGNLVSRQHFSGELLNKDAWTEDFFYDDLDRLERSELNIHTVAKDALLNGAVVENYNYDALGNLTRKGQRVSGYQYGGDNDDCTVRGPHAVSRVNVNGHERRYCYDANGNLLTVSAVPAEVGNQSETIAGNTTIAWSSYNKPLHIENTDGSSEFAYGPDRARYLHRKHHEGSTVTTWQLGSYERIDTAERTTHRFNIRAGSQVIAVKELDTPAHIGPTQQPIINTGNTTGLSFTTILNHRLHYLHRDHLGSVKLITDSQGSTVERLDYNAWGERRDLKPLQLAAMTTGLIDDWSATIDYPGASYQPNWANYHRGYTGHEQLDHLELVHMNGRIYDPVIGRFLSADPFVQFPESTQGFNRYTYVGNNPLSYSDPSGYFLKKLLGGLGISKHLGLIAPLLNFIPGCQIWCSALASGINGYLVTGSFSAGLKAGLTSAAMSYIGGQIGGADSGWIQGSTPGAIIGRAAAHGVVGGAFSKASGGRFGDGFLGGMAGSLVGNIGSTGNMAGDMIVGAATGGTVAVIGGGKFKNGAVTGAFAAGAKYKTEERRGESRSMTDGEKEMVRKHFGGKVDTDRVKIYEGKFDPFQSGDQAMAPDGNIYQGGKDVIQDYSIAKPKFQEHFIHEVAHVMQHQEGINVLIEGAITHVSSLGGLLSDPYDYTSVVNYGAMNIEQQATFLQDAFSISKGYKPEY